MGPNVVFVSDLTPDVLFIDLEGVGTQGPSFYLLNDGRVTRDWFEFVTFCIVYVANTQDQPFLGQSESQNGVGEELRLEGWVSGISDDEGSEHGSDSGSRSGDSDSSSSGTDELGSGVDIPVADGHRQGS